MSAYALFPSESLSLLKKELGTQSKITPLNTSIPTSNDIAKITSESAESLKTFSSCDSTNISMNTSTNNAGSCASRSYEKKELSVDADSSDVPENDLGIAVTSANLDRKRFIAASSASSTLNQVGSLDQWEAVEYELSINYSGKKYTAKRSFPRIMRLRNELIKEARNRRDNVAGTFGVIRSFMTPPAYHGTSHEEVHTKDTEDSVIPALPPDLCSECSDDGSDSSVSVGLAGKSLNMIQSSATGNCPRLEEWLKSVSKLVNPHTSPSLRSFLAEPLEPEVRLPNLFPRARRFLRKRRNRESFSSLSSISEDDVVNHEEISQLEIECAIEDSSVVDDDDDDDSFSEFDYS